MISFLWYKGVVENVVGLLRLGKFGKVVIRLLWVCGIVFGRLVEVLELWNYRVILFLFIFFGVWCKFSRYVLLGIVFNLVLVGMWMIVICFWMDVYCFFCLVFVKIVFIERDL